MKNKIYLSSVLILIAGLLISGTSFSNEYYDYHKWPITKPNKINLKEEMITYYNINKKPIEKVLFNFNREGYLVKMEYICMYLKEQSKKYKYYYKNNLLSKEEEYDHTNKLLSLSKYKYIDTSKIIRTFYSDSNIKYNKIYEYDSRGLLKHVETPIDEEVITYEYDNYKNISKVIFQGPDGVGENIINIEYDAKGKILKKILKHGEIRYTYYGNGRIKEIISTRNKSEYRFIKYESTSYSDEK